MNAIAAQDLLCAACRPYLEAEVSEPFDREDHIPLVLAGDRHECPALDRQRAVGGRLGLRVRGAEYLVDAHHLAGGAHLRPEDGVHALTARVSEPAERQDGLL